MGSMICYTCLHCSQYQSQLFLETNLLVGAFVKINFKSMQPCLNLTLHILGTMHLDLLESDTVDYHLLGPINNCPLVQHRWRC